MASDPKCPDCDGPIGADWDWCMHCGYDPDHLKPWDWRPASNQMSGSVQTATAPGQVDLIDLTERKRRSKRAERTKRKGRSRQAEQPEPKVATMATTSSLITLPARPSAPTAPSARPAPPAPGGAASPAPAAPTAPSPVAPRPEARQPEAAGTAAAPAPTRPAPAPTSPRSAATEPPVATAGPTSRQQSRAHAPTPGVPTRVISLPRTTLGLVPSIVLYVLAALMLFVALSSMLKLGEGSILSRATTVLFVLVCLALSCGMAAQGHAFMKVRVELAGSEIIAHNRFGRPSTARIRDIFSITMGSRRYLDVPLLGRSVEAPYVQMQDGSGFWLDALEGRAGQPPTPEQLAVVDALARTVAANRSGALHHEAGTGLV